MGSIDLSLRIALSLAEGLAAGFASIYIFNRIPARWLCDYGVEPEPGMWGERLPKRPWAWVLPLAFSVASFLLLRQSVSYQLAAMAALLFLFLIARADQQYGIIPDQLAFAVAVTALGFLPDRPEALPMLLGALLGGGCALAAALAGRLLFRREAMGFGDVKLLAALGLVTGVQGMAAVLLVTVFTSGLVFGCLVLAGQLDRQASRPLGPFIAGAGAAVLLFPREAALALAFFFPG